MRTAAFSRRVARLLVSSSCSWLRTAAFSRRVARLLVFSSCSWLRTAAFSRRAARFFVFASFFCAAFAASFAAFAAFAAFDTTSFRSHPPPRSAGSSLTRSTQVLLKASPSASLTELVPPCPVAFSGRRRQELGQPCRSWGNLRRLARTSTNSSSKKRQNHARRRRRRRIRRGCALCHSRHLRHFVIAHRSADSSSCGCARATLNSCRDAAARCNSTCSFRLPPAASGCHSRRTHRACHAMGSAKPRRWYLQTRARSLPNRIVICWPDSFEAPANIRAVGAI